METAPEANLFLPGEPIGIAGAGRMAQALGRLLKDRGEPVVAVASRTREHADEAAAFIGAGVIATDIRTLPGCAARWLIAVSDDAVSTVAALLAGSGARSGAALHTCGALGVEALRPLAEVGVSCGALHPLQTVPSPWQGVLSLPGAAFAIDGEGAALEWAGRIAALLGGPVLRIAPAGRALYHAAAAVASNYSVALVDAAVILMMAAGVEERAALQALGPLVRASFGNALESGPQRALTGPVARGDAGTVAMHLNALADAPVSVRSLYRAAGLHALDLARRRGLPETAASKLEELLQESSDKND